MVVEAKREYIDIALGIFNLMGEASGLFVKTTGVKAAMVPSQPVPPKLVDLD